jgi:hypothetical protein
MASRQAGMNLAFGRPAHDAPGGVVVHASIEVRLTAYEADPARLVRLARVYTAVADKITHGIRRRDQLYAILQLHDLKGTLTVVSRLPLSDETRQLFCRAWGWVGNEPTDLVTFEVQA